MKKSLRILLIDKFKALNEIETLSAIDIEQDPFFSWQGCQCCSPGIGSNVMECHGYDPERKEVVEVGDVCLQCLAVEANGFDCDTEIEEDNESIKKNRR